MCDQHPKRSSAPVLVPSRSRRVLPVRPSGSRRSKPGCWSFGLPANAERATPQTGGAGACNPHDQRPGFVLTPIASLPSRAGLAARGASQTQDSTGRRVDAPAVVGQAVESGRSQRRQPRRRVPLGLFERCEVTRVAGVLVGRRGVVDRPDERPAGHSWCDRRRLRSGASKPAPSRRRPGTDSRAVGTTPAAALGTPPDAGRTTSRTRRCAAPFAR